MNIRTIISTLAFVGILCSAQAKDTGLASGDPAAGKEHVWPGIDIKKGSLRVLVAIPDAQKGFYRGPRFDQSGFIYKARIGDLQLFGPWKLDFKQGMLDAVTGPAGEFGMKSPLGYEEATPGEGFVKIGVGQLKRIDDSPYSFTNDYEVLDPGNWTVSHGATFFEAQHELAPVRGWAYEYSKRIELLDESIIKISYRLKNTGTKEIVTDYYVHNLVVFNDAMVDKGDGAEILADLAGDALRKPAELTPRRIEFQEPITPGKGYYLEIPLPKDLKNPTLARIFNKKSGASVTVSADYAPYKLDFYAHDKALCVEPFVEINLNPGEEIRWSDTYHIHTVPSKGPPTPVPPP